MLHNVPAGPAAIINESPYGVSARLGFCVFSKRAAGESLRLTGAQRRSQGGKFARGPGFGCSLGAVCYNLTPCNLGHPCI